METWSNEVLGVISYLWTKHISALNCTTKCLVNA